MQLTKTSEIMKTKDSELLKASIGAWVRLVNVADVLMVSDKVTIHLHGKLDYTEDDSVYCVSTQDLNGHGTNSVSFTADRVESVFRQPSQIVEITLY